MFKVLTEDPWKIIYRSNIRLADDLMTCNLWLDPISYAKLVICSCYDSPHDGEQCLTSDSDQSLPMLTIDPCDLVDHTFLLPMQEDGQCFCAHIVKAMDDHESGLGQYPTRAHLPPMFG